MISNVTPNTKKKKKKAVVLSSVRSYASAGEVAAAVESAKSVRVEERGTWGAQTCASRGSPGRSTVISAAIICAQRVILAS
jgi:hypothetical protein